MIDDEVKKGAELRTKIIYDLIEMQCEIGYPATDMFWILYNEEKSCLPVGRPDYNDCMTAKYQKCYDRIETCVAKHIAEGID